MVIWLSGFLFLFCCDMPDMQAKEFCPLEKAKSHCDKAKAENDSPLVSKGSVDHSLDCCGFMPAVFDKTRKIEKGQQLTQPVDKVKVDLPKFVFIKNDFAASANYRRQEFSQNKIFIKNCIFRI